MALRLSPELNFTPIDLTPERKRAIDSKTFRAVLYPWLRVAAGYKKDLKNAREHYAAEFDRLVAKVRLDGVNFDPIQVDEKGRLIRAFRLLDAAILLADEGRPKILESLRVERVSGFADDYEIKTYVRAGSLSVHTPTRSEQRVLIVDEIAQDELRYETDSKRDGEAYRSSYSLIAARLGVSYHLVAKVEEESFPQRWRGYEIGQEKRLDTNGVPKAKRDRESPSAVQAIVNLFGGTSAETLDTLTPDKLEDAYKNRRKDLDPDFVTDAEIGKVVASYEFLKEEMEKRTPRSKGVETEGDGKPEVEVRSTAERTGHSSNEQNPAEPQGGDDKPEEKQVEVQGRTGDGVGTTEEPVGTTPAASSWLTPQAIAELREEAENIAEERAAIEDYLDRPDRPFTAGPLGALLDAGLIEVDEEGGKQIIRDWSLGDLRSFGGIVASLTPLESALRDLGVTKEIARKHVAAMIEEARGYERATPATESSIRVGKTGE